MNETMRQTFSKIFLWLCLGLLITFGTGYLVQNNEPLMNNLIGSGNYIFIWIAEIVIAIVLSLRIHKMNPVLATILYLAYTVLTGLTFSTIFIVYQLTSIIYVFIVTAIVLFIFGILGYTTKIDLSKLSTMLLIGLVAIILLSIISIFVESVALNLAVTMLSLIIFIIYIAYDIQHIKKSMMYSNNTDTLAVYGAFTLYIDFINIFLDLLSLFGKER